MPVEATGQRVAVVSLAGARPLHAAALWGSSISFCRHNVTNSAARVFLTWELLAFWHTLCAYADRSPLSSCLYNNLYPDLLFCSSFTRFSAPIFWHLWILENHKMRSLAVELHVQHCLCQSNPLNRVSALLFQKSIFLSPVLFSSPHFHCSHSKYKVIHKSLRDFRTWLRNNQDRHGRKEHINR